MRCAATVVETLERRSLPIRPRAGAANGAQGTSEGLEAVVVSVREMADWGVKEPGLMLASDSFGRVFTGPGHAEDWEDLEFISRGVVV